MKKYILIIGALLITLVACSKSKSSGGASENVTLSFAIWDNNQQPGMRAIADKFTENNPNITIEIQLTPWTEYWQKMRTSAGNGTLPDVFWMHVIQFNLFAQSDVLLPITDLISSSNIDTSNFPEDLIDLYTYEGNRYAIPKDFDTIGLWYNKLLFDEAGLEYPQDDWTWDDLLESARQLSNPAEGTYGFYMRNSDQEGYWNFIYQNQGRILTEDAKSGYSDPNTIEAVKWFADLALVHQVAPPLEDVLDNGLQWFQSGKIAMMLNGSWMISALKGNDYTLENTDVAMLPRGKQQATMYNGLGYVIGNNTEHPEESWKFLEYLASEEANLMQAEYGAAIPAFKGTQQPWIDFSPEFNIGIYPRQLDFAYPYPQAPGQADWIRKQLEMTAQILSGQVGAEEGLTQLAEEMDVIIAGNQ